MPHYLRSSIIGTATAGLQKVPISHDVAQAKIGNLDIHFAVQKQILGLEVSVHNHIAMAVLYTRSDLLKESTRFLFKQSAFLDNVVKQLARLQAFARSGAEVLCMLMVFHCCDRADVDDHVLNCANKSQLC